MVLHLINIRKLSAQSLSDNANFNCYTCSRNEICVYIYFNVYNICRIIYLVQLIDLIIIFNVTEEIPSQF